MCVVASVPICDLYCFIRCFVDQCSWSIPSLSLAVEDVLSLKVKSTHALRTLALSLTTLMLSQLLMPTVVTFSGPENLSGC